VSFALAGRRVINQTAFQARAANARRTLSADASLAFRCNFDKKIFDTSIRFFHPR
jgi:hypothetical protein